MTTITLPTQLPTAQVTLTTKGGRKIFTDVEITPFIKSQAGDLIDTDRREELTIWALADRMADVLGNDVAGEFLAGWGDNARKEDAYLKVTAWGGLYAAFVWADTRQGHEFWADVYDALTKIANA